MRFITRISSSLGRKLVKKNTVIILAVFISTFFITKHYHSAQSFQEIIHQPIEIVTNSENYIRSNGIIDSINQKCMPVEIKIDSYDKLIEQTQKKQHPNCSDNDWVIIQNDGTLTYDHEYLNNKNIQIKECKYQIISWDKNDFKTKKSEFKTIKDGEKLDLNEEFFSTECESQEKGKKYSNLHARIFKKKNENVNLPDQQPINILFIGLDSVSREKWLTNLPKSNKYLLETMKANVLNGYNIVGDGTPAAVIPLTTGKHENELPNTIKNTKNAKFCDEAYPFIWKNLSSKLNYASMYNEDWPNVGVFQYRMIGFKEPPTTHYLRPFHLVKSSGKVCHNGRSSIQINLDYIRDFMRVYKDQGFFSFSHIKQYTHNEGLNDISWLDDSFLNFYKKFYEDESLSSNTILFMFSDHGPRYSKFRKSIKGLLHERNAFFSIYIPKLFKERYPNEYTSLTTNFNKVIAPMDIHATLLNILDLETKNRSPKTSKVNYEKKRGTSLFSDISPDRTCDDAEIDPYWCSCLKRTSVKVDDYLEKLANRFTDTLNNELLKDHLDLCQKLEIDKINNVYLVDSYLNAKGTVRKVETNNTAIEKLKLLQPEMIEKDFKKYLYVVTTKPNNGEYEFTIEVERNVKSLNDNSIKEATIDKSLISRINKYGNDEFCIHDQFPDLRKYCFCKK